MSASSRIDLSLSHTAGSITHSRLVKVQHCDTRDRLA